MDMQKLADDIKDKNTVSVKLTGTAAPMDAPTVATINPNGGGQELTVPVKLTESRQQLARAYAQQQVEADQEIENLKARIDELSREAEKMRLTARGFESDVQMWKGRAEVFEAERDAAVAERIRVETIFKTLKSIVDQVNAAVRE